jgi:hypothetical protein
MLLEKKGDIYFVNRGVLALCFLVLLGQVYAVVVDGLIQAGNGDGGISFLHRIERDFSVIP